MADEQALQTILDALEDIKELRNDGYRLTDGGEMQKALVEFAQTALDATKEL